MKELNKEKIAKEFSINQQLYASVCNSCACGGGTASCNTTCKGCKDKGENIKEVRNIYKKS